MDEKDQKRIRAQEQLFGEYEHYQEQLTIVLFQKRDLERKLVELKARILETE